MGKRGPVKRLRSGEILQKSQRTLHGIWTTASSLRSSSSFVDDSQLATHSAEQGAGTACIACETVSGVATVQRGDTIIQEAEVSLSSLPLSTNDDVPPLLESEVANSQQTSANTAEKTKASKDSSVSMYKGQSLNLQNILERHNFLRKEVERKTGEKSRHTRTRIKCLLCFEFEPQVRRFSRNGFNEFASGARVDGQEKLKRLIDHLSSASHLEAIRLNDLTKEWENRSVKHPWLNALLTCEAQTLSTLFKMAVDVYNDTRLETVSARSWPSRSLAQMHADSCVARLADLGHDAPFEPFAPGGKILHYRDPVAYLEMQECIADDLVHDLVKELESCLVCSFQVDGSSNKCQVDQKYVSCRYVNAGEDTPKTRFIRVTEAEQRGAPGLLEAFCKAFDGKDNCGIGLSTETLQEKIIGLSTDGENANTGRKAGFWVLLEKQLQKKLMLVWCVCHRSDLAYEFVQSCVPELRHWRTNLTSLCSYFRRSSMKTKLLKKTASSVNDSVEESDEGEEKNKNIRAEFFGFPQSLKCGWLSICSTSAAWHSTIYPIAKTCGAQYQRHPISHAKSKRKRAAS